MLRRCVKHILIIGVSAAALLVAAFFLEPWNGSWWKYPFRVALWWHLDVLGEEEVALQRLVPFGVRRVCWVRGGEYFSTGPEVDLKISMMLGTPFEGSDSLSDLRREGGGYYMFLAPANDNEVLVVPDLPGPQRMMRMTTEGLVEMSVQERLENMILHRQYGVGHCLPDNGELRFVRRGGEYDHSGRYADYIVSPEGEEFVRSLLSKRKVTTKSIWP